MLKKIGRYGYLGVAVLFVVGILLQVYLVGLSLLGQRPSWDDHVGLGHGLGILALLLVLLVYVGRQSEGLKRLTWVNFVVYVLLADVVIFMRVDAPLVAALHPVLAITLFASAVTIAVRAWRAVDTESPGAVRAAAEVPQEAGA